MTYIKDPVAKAASEAALDAFIRVNAMVLMGVGVR